MRPVYSGSWLMSCARHHSAKPLFLFMQETLWGPSQKLHLIWLCFGMGINGAGRSSSRAITLISQCFTVLPVKIYTPLQIFFEIFVLNA